MARNAADKVPPISGAATKEYHQRDRARRWQTERLRRTSERVGDAARG